MNYKSKSFKIQILQQFHFLKSTDKANLKIKIELCMLFAAASNKKKWNKHLKGEKICLCQFASFRKKNEAGGFG